jgi:uncharacterized membrane protein
LTVPQAPGGLVDTTTVTATSQGDPRVFDTVVNTTTLDVETGAVFTPNLTDTVVPGETVTYTHMLTNTGEISLTFDFSLAQTASWAPAPAPVTLAPAASTEVSVTVTAPIDALAGATHAVTVTAIAREDATVAVAVRDVTTVTQVYSVTLVPDQTGAGRAGETVVYTHTLTNHGNGEDSFEFLHAVSQGWPVGLTTDPVTVTRGGAQTITVTVTIPDDAAVGTEEVVWVRAHSVNNATVHATAVNTTTVVAEVAYLVYMPLVMRVQELGDGPDLVVTGITVSSPSPKAGDPVTVRVSVQNQGNQPIAYGNNFWVDLYINREPRPSNAGELSWGAQGAWFGVGETYIFTASHTFSEPGEQQLYAQADTDNTVVEGNEANNTFGPYAVTVTGVQQRGVVRTPAPPVIPDVPRPTPTPMLDSER